MEVRLVIGKAAGPEDPGHRGFAPAGPRRGWARPLGRGDPHLVCPPPTGGPGGW